MSLSVLNLFGLVLLIYERYFAQVEVKAIEADKENHCCKAREIASNRSRNNSMSINSSSNNSEDEDDGSNKWPSDSSAFSVNNDDEQDEEENKNLVNWGDRLPDDLINTFCDRLSDVKKDVEGLLAIQSISLDADELKKMITGKKQVLQILLDQSMAHFVLLEWRADKRRVYYYDPFMPGCNSSNEINKRLTRDVRRQIASLFGHLFPEENNNNEAIAIIVERGLQQQRDDWSCGLRAIGCLLLRVFNKNAEDFDMNLKKVLTFFLHVLNSKKKPTLEQFRSADFAMKRNVVRENSPVRVLLNRDTLDVAIQVHRKPQ